MKYLDMDGEHVKYLGLDTDIRGVGKRKNSGEMNCRVEWVKWRNKEVRLKHGVVCGEGRVRPQ